MSEDLRKEIIISVNTDTSGAEKGVDQLKDKLKGVNDTPLDKPFVNLKKEIKEASLEAQKMGEQFGLQSKQFAEAAQKVANLKDKFQEVNQAVAAFNPDNKMQALVNISKGAIGTLQGVTGAMAFLGVESGTAAETMAKLQGVMAFADALNSLDDIKNSFKNFGSVIQNTTAFQKANAVATGLASGAMKLFGVAADTTSFSFKALKVAIASTGIGLIVVAIGALLPMISDWIDNTEEAEAAQKSLEDAVSSLNSELDANLKAIQNQGKEMLLQAKIAGKSTEEQYQIQKANKIREYKSLVESEEQKRRLYNQSLENENLKTEDIKKIGEEHLKSQQAIADKAKEIELGDLEEKARIAEEGRKKQKEVADKAHQQSEQAAAKRKALQDKEAAERKSALEEIEKINKESAEKILESGLSEMEKEVAQLTYEFETKKAKFQKYGQDTVTITKEYNIAKAAIQKKYADEEAKTKKEVDEFILDQSGNAYEKEKAAIEKKYQEMSEKATDFGQRLALTALQTEQLLNLKNKQDAADNSVKAETTLVNTQVENKVLETDDAETRKEKLANVYNAEIEAENAAYALKLEGLKGNQAEIELATAEHNSKLAGMHDQLAKDKKAIDDAEKAAKLETYKVIEGAADVLGDVLGKHTVAGKALAVATTTIDTYMAAQKAYQSQLTIPSPDAPVRAAIAAGTAIAQGLLRVKSILAVKVPGSSGGGGSVPSAPSVAPPQINSTVLQDTGKIQDVRVTNQQESVVKAYVSQRDLQSAEDKSQFINKLSSF